MTTWWIDAGAGASGDMLLGALLGLDAGGLAPAQQAVDEVLGRLGPERVRLEVQTTRRAGMAATRAHVRCEQTAGHRTWRDIAPALEGFAPAESVFRALAAAEAQVHGVPVDQIHFHEVGALDAIADIVAVTTLWERLQPSVVVVSPVCVGSGSVRTAHGELSVPVPAVVQLLRGAPTFAGNTAHEACTPTGAALLHFMATGWGSQPLMTVERIAVGAGGRDLPERPNVVRVLAGQSADRPGTEALVLVETTIDDLDPRVYPDVLAGTKQAGALESWLTPVVMKQGRPAVVVTALCQPSVAGEVAGVLFRQTPTLGVRYTNVDRQALRRDFVTVEVQGHAIRVKRGWFDGEAVTVQPEYREALAAAKAIDRPVRHVLDEARRLATEG
ncbi:MAG: nickel pincer cofactor biosynthesis protein LarC [Candidatus Nanopelagicales bacterium]